MRPELAVMATVDALPAVADDVPVPRLRRLMLKALALPVVIMLLLCGLLTWQLKDLVELGDWVARSQQVITETNRTQKLLLDHETGLRGFLLTREDPFLEPFRAGSQQLPENLQRLADLVADDPPQQERVRALSASCRKWMHSVDPRALDPAERVALDRIADTDLLANIRNRHETMVEIRRLVDEIIAEEERLLASRKAQVRASTRAAMIGGVALLLALGVAMATVLRRWIRTMEGTYAKALARRRQSEANERAARQAAEALAGEITAQGRELEVRLKTMRSELAAARATSSS